MKKNIMLNWELDNALSPYNKYCYGFGYSGCRAYNYISTFILGTGKTEITLAANGHNILDKIIAYDRAEVESTFIGQINMIKVSSFCGPQGRIWGYDLMKPDNLYVPHDNCFTSIKDVPVYSLNPLYYAGKALFGTLEKKNFPLLPGSHVPCAYKKIEKQGPCTLICGSAVGIPNDRRHDACLFMEDILTITKLYDKPVQYYERMTLENLARSVIRIGENQKVSYKEIFIGAKYITVESHEVGCALVSNPYFTLARNAVNDYILENYANITLGEWEQLIF